MQIRINLKKGARVLLIETEIKSSRIQGLGCSTRERIASGDHARHMNHSDTPNLRGSPEGTDIAVCGIEIGEELTCDHVEFDLDAEEKNTS